MYFLSGYIIKSIKNYSKELIAPSTDVMKDLGREAEDSGMKPSKVSPSILIISYASICQCI